MWETLLQSNNKDLKQDILPMYTEMFEIMSLCLNIELNSIEIMFKHYIHPKDLLKQSFFFLLFLLLQVFKGTSPQDRTRALPHGESREYHLSQGARSY